MYTYMYMYMYRNWPLAKKPGGRKRGLYSESVRGL